MDAKERFNEFSKDPAKCWKERFGWRGLFGDEHRPAYNIIKFMSHAKDTGTDAYKEFMNIDKFSTVGNLYKSLSKLADEYANWVGFYDKELDQSLRNHFIGALGEFFFFSLLTYCRTFDLRYNSGDNVKTKFYFSDISPRLTGEQDYGVDLTCICQYRNEINDMAIQVKFWNPALKNTEEHPGLRPVFDYSTASHVYTDAMTNGIIDNKSHKSVMACWLYEDKDLSSWLRKNTNLFPKMVFMHGTDVKYMINHQFPGFWQEFKDRVNSIADWI